MNRSNSLMMSAAAILTGAGMFAVPAPAASAAGFDPLDFAVEVVEYVPGMGVGFDAVSGEPFDNPQMALGPPTVDTTGTGFEIPADQAVPVVPVYPAFRAHELVTIGDGGWLTLRFGRPVYNDPFNPYGIDFIIFGNAAQQIDGFHVWNNGDPNQTTVGSGAITDRGRVSVSQDGDTWYTFTDGPFADDFAPTLGRAFDPDNPYRPDSDWDWNHWWGGPADPGVPLPPGGEFADKAGLTVAEYAQSYRDPVTGQVSAGGTGFDLSWLEVEGGLEWIQYVRIEPAVQGARPDIDAVSIVRPRIPGDANLDGHVDLRDASILLAHWGQTDVTWVQGDFTGDGGVGPADLALLLENWSGPAPAPTAMFDALVVPEPSAWWLLAAGAGGCLLRRRRGGISLPVPSGRQPCSFAHP